MTKQLDGKLMVAILKLSECENLIRTKSVREIFENNDLSERFPFNENFSELLDDYTTYFPSYYEDKVYFDRLKNIVNSKLVFSKDKLDYILNSDTLSLIQDKYVRTFIFNILLSYKCIILLIMRNEIIFNKEELRNLEFLARDIIGYCINNKVLETKVFTEYNNSINKFIAKEFPNN